MQGSFASWRYEFIVVGAFCSAWALILWLLLPNSPTTFWGFSRAEKLMMIARLRQNQTGVEQRQINWGQVREAYYDYKTWLFTLLGFVANIPNGGLSNFSTLVIKGLGFDALHTALLGIPQGVIIVVWIGLGALCNDRMPKNSRTYVCAVFMLPTIAGALGFLLAPDDAYVGRLICLYAWIPWSPAGKPVMLTPVSQLPHWLLPGLLRPLLVAHHVQHRRAIQKDDRVGDDLVRRMLG